MGLNYRSDTEEFNFSINKPIYTKMFYAESDIVHVCTLYDTEIKAGCTLLYMIYRKLLWVLCPYYSACLLSWLELTKTMRLWQFLNTHLCQHARL